MKQQPLLIIKDDPSGCELLANCLGSLNGRVSIVHSGEEGLCVLDEDRPQLFILALALPGMNGLVRCRAMRRDPWIEKIHVLMLTGRVEDDDIVAGLEVGADDYMTKSFAAKELKARVNTRLRRGQDTLDARAAAVHNPQGAT
jgi:DNA-binding response OmpR family regulator